MTRERIAAGAKAAARRLLPVSLQHQIRDYRDHPPLVPVEELSRVYRRAVLHLRQSGSPVGDYLEFGVFRGDSLLCMDRIRREADMSFRLFGFDSFEGLPGLSPGDERLGWTPGSFSSGYNQTRRRLEQGGIDWSRTVLVKGWYDQTLTPELRKKHRLSKASMVMIDCDLYSSTKTALEFVAPLIVDEAIIFFDDWDAGIGLAEQGEGEGRAFSEFLRKHPELSAEEFDAYYHTELKSSPIANVFRVCRVSAIELEGPASGVTS